MIINEHYFGRKMALATSGINMKKTLMGLQELQMSGRTRIKKNKNK